MNHFLSFDIGGTLLREGEQSLCSFVCETLRSSLPSLRLPLEQHLLTKNRPVTESLDAIYDVLHIPVPQRRYPERSGRCSELFHDALPALARAKRAGFCVISLSNCTRWEADHPLPAELLQVLDAVFRSFEIASAKPNPSAFHAVEAAVGRPSHAFIHVGDTWDADVDGALSSGWRAVYLDRHGRGGPPHAHDSVPVITSLHELMPVLEDQGWL